MASSEEPRPSQPTAGPGPGVLAEAAKVWTSGDHAEETLVAPRAKPGTDPNVDKTPVSQAGTRPNEQGQGSGVVNTLQDPAVSKAPSQPLSEQRVNGGASKPDDNAPKPFSIYDTEGVDPAAWQTTINALRKPQNTSNRQKRPASELTEEEFVKRVRRRPNALKGAIFRVSKWHYGVHCCVHCCEPPTTKQNSRCEHCGIPAFSYKAKKPPYTVSCKEVVTPAMPDPTAKPTGNSIPMLPAKVSVYEKNVCLDCYRWVQRYGPMSIEKKRCIQCECPADLRRIVLDGTIVLICADCYLLPSCSSCVRCDREFSERVLGPNFKDKLVKIRGRPGVRMCESCTLLPEPDQVDPLMAPIPAESPMNVAQPGTPKAMHLVSQLPMAFGAHRVNMCCEHCGAYDMEGQWYKPVTTAAESVAKWLCRQCRNRLRTYNTLNTPACGVCGMHSGKTEHLDPSSLMEKGMGADSGWFCKSCLEAGQQAMMQAGGRDAVRSCEHCKKQIYSCRTRGSFNFKGHPGKLICKACWEYSHRRFNPRPLHTRVCGKCGKSDGVHTRTRAKTAEGDGAEVEELICPTCEELEKIAEKCDYCKRSVGLVKSVSVPGSKGLKRWCTSCANWKNKYGNFDLRVCCKCKATELVQGARLGKDRNLYCPKCMPHKVKMMMRLDVTKREPRCSHCEQRLPPHMLALGSEKDPEVIAAVVRQKPPEKKKAPPKPKPPKLGPDGQPLPKRKPGRPLGSKTVNRHNQDVTRHPSNMNELTPSFAAALLSMGNAAPGPSNTREENHPQDADTGRGDELIQLGERGDDESNEHHHDNNDGGDDGGDGLGIDLDVDNDDNNEGSDNPGFPGEQEQRLELE